MARAAPLQSSFNGGEISQLIAARSDVAKYGNACEVMENFIPTIQGPAIARPGFPFVAEVKDSGDRTWLVKFIFSEDQAYMLEFGDLYVRFYYGREQVITGPSTPYEIVSPWPASALTNSEGGFALAFAQSGDEIRLCHPSYAPYLLSRLGPTNWTLTKVAFAPPPFKKNNTTDVTMVASGKTGVVDIDASVATFTSSDVGRWLYLQEKDVRDIPLWEAGATVSVNDKRRSGQFNYTAMTAGTTGTTKPTHTVGTQYDGDAGVKWRYDDAGFGWAEITGYYSTTKVSANVGSQIPDGASGANATTRWAFSAWSAADGYPTAPAFFRGRCVYAWGQSLAFSVSDDYDNFAYTVQGVVTADAGFQRDLASGRVNTIRWLSPADVLFVGTEGDEWVITEATTTEPLSPANAKASPRTYHGSAQVQPVQVGNETIFVQKSGKKVRALSLDGLTDKGAAPDLTAFAPHITQPRITQMAYQQEPWSVVWGVRSDGQLIGATFSREQDVLAMHRHTFEGGIVECIETLPAPDLSRDDLWAIVRYTVDGATRRYVCYLGVEDDESGSVAQEDWCYSDQLLTYDGAPNDTISGLDHLEGMTVWVLADGTNHPNRVVTSGAITLTREASKVQIGLPCVATLQTTAMEPGAPTGSSFGDTKRAQKVVVRVLRSLGGSVGPDADHLQDMQQRPLTTPMGSGPAPFSGDVVVDFDGGYATRLQVMVRKDSPRPLTVVAIAPKLSLAER
jgi:hypothetical protein